MQLLGFHLVTPPREFAGGSKHLAVLTVESGGVIVRGFRLATDETGRHFLLPPLTRNANDRVILRRGPERDALLRSALASLRAFAARPAEAPLATASEPSEHRE